MERAPTRSCFDFFSSWPPEAEPFSSLRLLLLLSILLFLYLRIYLSVGILVQLRVCRLQKCAIVDEGWRQIDQRHPLQRRSTLLFNTEASVCVYFDSLRNSISSRLLPVMLCLLHNTTNRIMTSMPEPRRPQLSFPPVSSSVTFTSDPVPL